MELIERGGERRGGGEAGRGRGRERERQGEGEVGRDRGREGEILTSE